MVNELNKNIDKKGTGVGLNISSLLSNSQNIQETNNTQLVTEIAKSNKEIESLKKLFREFNEKIEKITKTNYNFEEQIYSINEKLSANKIDKSSSIKLMKTNSIVSNDKKNDFVDENNLEQQQIENDSNKQSMEMLFDRTKKMQELMKSSTVLINNKISKDDFEKITKNINLEMEKLNNKIIEMNKNTEAKIKTIIQNGSIIGGGGNINLQSLDTKSNFYDGNKNKSFKLPSDKVISAEGFEFDEGIVNVTKELIEKEFSTRLEILEFRDFILEFKQKSENNIEDINKIFESLVDIRNSLSEASNIKEKFSEISDKIEELDYSQKKYKLNLEERFKILEGDGVIEDENVADNQAVSSGGTIKDIVKNLSSNLKTLTEKIEKVTSRQDNMNNEILSKVKKDLSNESGKILDEFKVDLKLSITKIEDQLTEKVDRFSLDEFGKRVDNKLNNEINKKLDRNDLKKNNNIINKKIDTLENKISKTLVDTLIDLQMEEAPLIVKKSMNGEKCASCNQFVQNGQGTVYPSDDCSNNHYNSQKFKFKNVQENCYKFGAGSYSRYLSSMDNVNEEIKNKTVLLPEIKDVKSSKKFNQIELKSTKNKYEDFTEKNFNIFINEELEKKLLNPENLIKTANKLYESVEKEKRNAMNKN